MTANDFKLFDDELFAKYFAGMVELSDGTNIAPQLKSVLQANLQSQIASLETRQARAASIPQRYS